MKKLLCTIICLIMVFALCACGANTVATDDSSNSGTTITDTDASNTNDSSENNNDNNESEENQNKIVCSIDSDGNNIVVNHSFDKKFMLFPSGHFSYPGPTSKYDEIMVLNFTLPLEKVAKLDYQGINLRFDSTQDIDFGFIRNDIYEIFNTGELRVEITHVKDYVSKSGITYKVFEHRQSHYYFGSISEEYAVFFRCGLDDESLIDSISFAVEKQ
ncbi:MAG: hypothetical protein IIU66_07120 [Clostridia bacterium]|nr:hypothetical protein [Clostridia bacterium]